MTFSDRTRVSQFTDVIKNCTNTKVNVMVYLELSLYRTISFCYKKYYMLLLGTIEVFMGHTSKDTRRVISTITNTMSIKNNTTVNNS